MKEWTEEQIKEAYTFNWILFNKDGKPYVDAECYRCGKIHIHESVEGNIMPMYCPECIASFK